VDTAIDNGHKDDILQLIMDIEEDIAVVERGQKLANNPLWELCGDQYCFKKREICGVNGQCQCRPGWKTTENPEDRNCGHEINECKEKPMACPDKMSMCINRSADDNLYACLCKQGYKSVETNDHGDTKCIEESSCYFDADNICGGTECVATNEEGNHYECYGCKTGYVGNDIFCVKESRMKTTKKYCENIKTPIMKRRNRNCNMLNTKKTQRKL
jgi:hypothetical protein